MLELGLDPVDVAFFIDNNMFEQLSAGVVAGVKAGFYAGLQHCQSGLFKTQVVL